MALSADRQTYAKYQGVYNTYKVKASAKIYMGALVMVVGGYLTPAADTSGGLVVGRADDSVDNTGGADGAKTCRVQQGVYLWNNSTGDAVVAADMGKKVFAEDDQTVNHTGGTNHVGAGVALQIDDNGGIWVDTQPSGGL